MAGQLVVGYTLAFILCYNCSVFDTSSSTVFPEAAATFAMVITNEAVAIQLTSNKSNSIFDN
jgi:hypothetical protein